MGVPVQDQDQATHPPYGFVMEELDALRRDQPALRLAGEDGDENEPHIWRGID